MDRIRENIQNQLDEIESLQSMFSNAGEFKIEDPIVVREMQNYVKYKDAGLYPEMVPPSVDFVINLVIDGEKIELCVNLTSEYPDNAEPDLFVRNAKLDKRQHALLNADLVGFIGAIPRGEICIFTAISWLQDNAGKYIVQGAEPSNITVLGGFRKVEGDNDYNDDDDDANLLVRYWIYSHHIYSKSKRREIQSLAHALDVCGFLMPGKPGLICIEGRKRDCDEWWQGIKSMNWKRIFLKITEVIENSEVVRCFRTFEEVVFHTNNVHKCTHMDMGELHRYLDDHQCGYIFKEIFGVDASMKSGSNNN